LGILGLPLGRLGTKWHLGVGLVARHKVYYKGKVVACFKFGPWWILWVRVYSWLIHAPKVLQLCTNQLVVWFVHVVRIYCTPSPLRYALTNKDPVGSGTTM
jgi:hypothetical protein